MPASWCRPDRGMLKLNFDASWGHESDAGVGDGGQEL